MKRFDIDRFDNFTALKRKFKKEKLNSFTSESSITIISIIYLLKMKRF